MVRIEDMKPMVMNVNGEDIALPNRFTFDIRPTCFKSDSSDGSSGCSTFGVLRRVTDPKFLSGKISSNWMGINDELPNDIQALLNIRKLPSSNDRPREHEHSQQDASAAAERPQDPKDTMGVPEHSGTPPQDDEEQRFRNMINRLQKRLPTPSLVQPRIPSIKLQPADPAILSAKLKDGAVLENAQLSRVTEVHPERKGGSNDSGYASASNPSTTIHYSTPENSMDSQGEPVADTKRSLECQSATKKLNPAAAEFKISSDSVHLPVLTPKKLSRGPLTSILFNPSPDAAVAGSVPSVEKLQSAKAKQETGTAVDMTQTQQSSPTKSSAKAKHRKASQVPPTQQACPPSTQNPSNSGLSNVNLMAGTHPILGLQPQRTDATLPLFPAPWMGGLGLGNFGTFPPSAAPSMAAPPFNMQAPSMTASLGTGTFLPSMRPPIPPFAPAPVSGIGSIYPQAAVPAVPPVRPTIPLAGVGQPAQPGPKGDRPYFPVTTKPRVPDPIKQQQYEEYLEWRKANEPGYHIKCKIRQANRVVRQHKHQVEAPKLEDPNLMLTWKAKAEEAKAAVGALEARRAAERRLKQNSVAEEFKAKVFERVMADVVKKDDKASEEKGKKEVPEKKNGKEALEKNIEDKQASANIAEKVAEEKVATEKVAEKTPDDMVAAEKKTEVIAEGVTA